MPAKKKKSGKKKLAKMTEEEKLLYLEQKRLAEEEMKKKKEDMLTQFLKVSWCICEAAFYVLELTAMGIFCFIQDKLAKEEKSTKFNLNKLQNQWRVIMRESTLWSYRRLDVNFFIRGQYCYLSQKSRC